MNPKKKAKNQNNNLFGNKISYNTNLFGTPSNKSNNKSNFEVPIDNNNNNYFNINNNELKSTDKNLDLFNNIDNNIYNNNINIQQNLIDLNNENQLQKIDNNNNNEEEIEKEELKENEILNKKCSLDEHKEIDAILYCQECRINMCNTCQKVHSKLLKNHHIYPLDKDIKEIFTGLCTKQNHSLELEFYCKTHNQLCCAACISKIKIKGKGQHNNCEVFYITKIKNKKKKI